MYKIDSPSIYSAHNMARNSGTEQIITNAQDVDREQYNGGEEERCQDRFPWIKVTFIRRYEGEAPLVQCV